MVNIVPEIPVVKIPEIQPLSLEAHQEAALAIGDEAAPSGVLGIVTRGLENHEAPREILEDVAIPPTEASEISPQENLPQAAAAAPEGAQPAATVVAEGVAQSPAIDPQTQQETTPTATQQTEQAQEQNLAQNLEARRPEVVAGLRIVGRILLDRKDPMAIFVTQAIGAANTPIGDQLREAVLARATSYCSDKYPNVPTRLSEGLIENSPLSSVAIENTPMADLLVGKGFKRDNLRAESGTTHEQTESLYRQMLSGQLGGVIGTALWGNEWRSVVDLRPQNMLGKIKQVRSGDSLAEAFKVNKHKDLSQMFHADGSDPATDEENFKKILKQQNWEALIAQRKLEARKFLHSHAIEITFLVFMNLMQTMQKGGREQAAE